jgi:hypothetical protein
LKSLGLLHLRERAELLDGSFVVKSQLGQGTEIEVQIPLAKPSETTSKGVLCSIAASERCAIVPNPGGGVAQRFFVATHAPPAGSDEARGGVP